jgi:sugar lactone lactonase YvrE
MNSRLRRLARFTAAAIGFVTVVASTAPASAATTLTPQRFIPNPAKSGHAYLYGWGATTLLDGTVLIGDYWNYQIRHFAKDGTELPIFYKNRGFGVGQTQAPYGMGTDPVDGSVYMADTDRYKIDHFDSTGHFINQFGTQGTGVGKFQYPSRVAIDRNHLVYVADTWANTIVVTNSTGTEQRRFGTFGTGNGQFKQPHGMVIWENGTPSDTTDDVLFVNDNGNKRVVGFKLDGTWVRNIGSPGSQCPADAPPQFVGDQRGLALDQANGLLYVVDSAGNKIHKVSIATGNSDATTPCIGSEGPGDVNAPAALGKFTDGGREATVDGDGNLWVGDMPNFRAQKFAPDGTALLQVPPPSTPNWAPPTGAFNGPRGVAVDATGNFFVTDTYNQRIEKLGPTGTFINQWGSRGRDPYAFNYARMIAVNRTDGSVWVADTDNHTIKKYDNNGLWQCQIGSLGIPGSTGGKFRNPHGIDVGPDGRVYVADSRNARVQILDSNCNFLSMWGTKGSAAGQLSFPRGIAVDTDNSVWVADATLNVVKHFTNTGAYLGTIGTKGTADNQWKNPFDIALDANNVYVVDTLANKVKVWSKAGVFQSAIGGGGKALGKLLKPNGIDIRNGHIYVAEQDNERIQDFLINP